MSRAGSRAGRPRHRPDLDLRGTARAQGQGQCSGGRTAGQHVVDDRDPQVPAAPPQLEDTLQQTPALGRAKTPQRRGRTPAAAALSIQRHVEGPGNRAGQLQRLIEAALPPALNVQRHRNDPVRPGPPPDRPREQEPEHPAVLEAAVVFEALQQPVDGESVAEGRYRSVPGRRPALAFTAEGAVANGAGQRRGAAETGGFRSGQIPVAAAADVGRQTGPAAELANGRTEGLSKMSPLVQF